MKLLKLLTAVNLAASIGICASTAAFSAPMSEFVVFYEDFCSSGVASTVLPNEKDWYCRAEYLDDGEYKEANRTGTRFRALVSISDEGTKIKNSTADFKAWLYKMYNNKYLSSFLTDNYYIEMNIRVDDYISGFDGENRFSAMFQFSQQAGDDLIKFSVEEDGIKYLSDSGWQTYTDFTAGNELHTYKLEVSYMNATMYIDGNEAFSYTLPVSDEFTHIRFGCGSRGEFDQGQCLVSDMKFAKQYEDSVIIDELKDFEKVSSYENVTLLDKSERYGTANGIGFKSAGYIEYDLTDQSGLSDIMLNFTSETGAYEDVKITGWDIFGNEIEISKELFDMIDFAGRLSDETSIRRTFCTNEDFEEFISANFSITKIRIEYTGNTDDALELLNTEITYTDAQYPYFVGVTAGSKEITDNMISAAAGTVELEFSCDARTIDNKDGDIRLFCEDEEVVTVISKEGTKIIIKPENGFLYGKNYRLTLSDSLVNSGIRDMPSEIAFATYSCDYEAKDAVFDQGSCNFTLKSNYIDDRSVAVIIVSYKDGAILDMNSIEVNIKAGEEKQITTGSIVTEDADDVAVMIWDSLRSRKALVRTIR